MNYKTIKEILTGLFSAELIILLRYFQNLQIYICDN